MKIQDINNAAINRVREYVRNEISVRFFLNRTCKDKVYRQIIDIKLHITMTQ